MMFYYTQRSVPCPMSLERLSLPVDKSRYRDSQSIIMQKESPNWRSPSDPSPWRLVNTTEEGKEEFQETENTAHRLSRAHRSSQRLNWQSHSLHGSVLGPLCISRGCQFGFLGGLLIVGVRGILDFFNCFLNPFPSTGFPLPALI